MHRIAMISDHASPLAAIGGADAGGQNVYVAHLSRCLADRGVEVDVFTRRDAPDQPEVVAWYPNSRVIHVPAGPPEQIPKEELLPHMAEFTRYVRRACRRRRYDLLHANFWMSGLTAADVKRSLGIPFVITFHALGRIRRAHQGAADRFPDTRFEHEEHIACVADRVIAECPQDRADLMTHYAADPERISIVPCGFDPAELWPVPRDTARALLGLPKDAFIVLQLGRLVPRKGIATVIEGFARFVHAEAVDARLLIVGGDFHEPNPTRVPEIARLSRVAAEARISDRVAFAGRRDREVLRYYYSAADVFVTLPWYEPFGITPLEAMACAVPVIGSRVGGVKYTVVDGKTGRLIPPADPEALARCLALFRRERTMRDAMGRAGRARVVRHFTWRHVARAIEDVYAAVLERAVEEPRVRYAGSGYGSAPMSPSAGVAPRGRSADPPKRRPVGSAVTPIGDRTRRTPK
ncbi:MAG: glycosyltransferase [Gammaproteobacteria bacterium]|nr:glycosyltransferase family 1 protein [Gammaproteobacteria bacterium]